MDHGASPENTSMGNALRTAVNAHGFRLLVSVMKTVILFDPGRRPNETNRLDAPPFPPSTASRKKLYPLKILKKPSEKIQVFFNSILVLI